MTLLGELHSHGSQSGLSISHLTRAISVENVCEHPLDPLSFLFFCCFWGEGVLFLYLQSQNVSHPLATLSSVRMIQNEGET